MGDQAAKEVAHRRAHRPADGGDQVIAASGDPGRAEDAVQDAFMNIWNRAASFDADRGSLRAWLLTSVRNRCIDYLRGRGAHERQERELQPELAYAASPSDPWREVALSLERAA